MEGNKFMDLVSYFKTLAGEHVDLKGFYRYELDEVLTEVNDLQVPCLILEGYKFGFKDGKSDNVMKIRSGAFILLDSVQDAGDYDAIHQCWEALEEIGDDILARVKRDKRNLVSPVRGLDFETVDGSLLATELNNYYGIRFTFDMDCAFNADVNNKKWITNS